MKKRSTIEANSTQQRIACDSAKTEQKNERQQQFDEF